MKWQQSGRFTSSRVRAGIGTEGLCGIWAAQSSAQQRLFASGLMRAEARKSCRLFGRLIMKAISNFVAGLIKDEQGGEVLEYALIAGLIVVAAIAVIGSVGGKVLARWNSLNSSM